MEEARTLARFDHPNIVKAVRIFDANNTSYMVQEYQTGRDLRSWVASLELPPTQTELDLLISPLLDALSLVHRNQVLHRDISPDNIYIRDDGTPVLLDFGSARQAVAQRTETVSAMVKSGYSPPEQYSTKAKSQGPWSDIYSFAATVYSIVSGTPPEPATERLMEDGYVPMRSVAKGTYRRTFMEAIDWGLQLAPDNRPASVGEWSWKLLMDLDPEEIDVNVPDGRVTDRPVSQGRPGVRIREQKQKLAEASTTTKIVALVLLTVGVLIAGVAVKNKRSIDIPQTKEEQHTGNSAPSELEKAAWQNVSFFDKDGLRAFIRSFPNSRYRKVAEDRIVFLEREEERRKQLETPSTPPAQRTTDLAPSEAEKVAWQNVSFFDKDGLRAFIRSFPNSRYRKVAEDRIVFLEREEERRKQLEVQAAPPPTSPPMVHFTLSNEAGRKLLLGFYEDGKGQVEPSPGKAYVFGAGEVRNYPVHCRPGAKICYGAWVEGDPLGPYWGEGQNGGHPCTGCCLTCSSSAPQTVESLKMGNSSVPSPTLTWKITDRTGHRMSIAFFSQTRKGHVWRDGDKGWMLMNVETNHKLNCVAGETICYGAWRQDDSSDVRSWGAGRTGSLPCKGCCTTCNGGVFAITLTD